MKFRTEVEIPNLKHKIEYHDPLFFIGSCFATNIGQQCASRGLNTMINPFGVTYNPLSVVSVLRHVCESKEVDDTMYREVDGKWCSLLHHSSFDSESKSEIQNKTAEATKDAHTFLRNSTHLFITLGTAWVYIDRKNVNVVNNCHKIPDNEFIRRRLSVEEIVDNFSALFDCEELLTNKKIVFTVSPIRHLKDSLAGNSLGKATLITAVWRLCEKYPDRVSYFPSYEIMMDDLRDYRFYEADMVHPSAVAIKYIYTLFEESLMTKETSEFCRRMERIESARGHRVTNENSEAHLKFKENMLSTLLQISKEYPKRDFSTLIDFFK